MNDQIDVGVFAAAEKGKSGEGKPLYFAKHRIGVGRSADRGRGGRGAGARGHRPVPQADRSGDPRQHRRRDESATRPTDGRARIQTAVSTYSARLRGAAQTRPRATRRWRSSF